MHSNRVASLPLLALLVAPAAAQLTDAQSSAIDALCARFKADGPGVSIAVRHRGTQVFAKGYGCAQVEYGVPIQPATVFHVASVTKQFTAFAVVLLAQEGKLSLDDDIRKHLPWMHDFGAPITIRHMLNHTSGLRDQWSLLVLSGMQMDDVLAKDHILRILRHQRELNFAPGSRHMYCNSGYTLAAHIVDRVAGKPFEDFCAERIFAPLGMKRTHVHVDHRTIVPGRAYSYAPRPEGLRKAVLSYANAGATSLFTTAPDLTLWLHNLGTGAVGGADAVQALQERGVLSGGSKIDYALGVSHGTHRGRATVSHAGADAGFRSEALWLPKEQLAIAVLANVADADPVGLARRVADVVLGDTAEVAARPAPRRPRRPADAAGRPDGDGKEFFGRYYCPELEVYYSILNDDGGRLVIRQRRRGDALLRVVGDDLCAAVGRGAPSRLRFTRTDGKVDGFRLDAARVLGLRFVRVD